MLMANLFQILNQCVTLFRKKIQIEKTLQLTSSATC
jgi:hypothetical protein